MQVTTLGLGAWEEPALLKPSPALLVGLAGRLEAVGVTWLILLQRQVVVLPAAVRALHPVYMVPLRTLQNNREKGGLGKTRGQGSRKRSSWTMARLRQERAWE